MWLHKRYTAGNVKAVNEKGLCLVRSGVVASLKGKVFDPGRRTRMSGGGVLL